eukprot:Platyproteum_vivax@DN4547_c0_g1_i1.p1
MADNMLQVNLHAPIRLICKLGPSMAERKQGTIINIGSIAGLDAMAPSAGYCASKWGLRGWHLSSYEEFRKHNVKVMLISPSFVRTDMVTSVPNINPDRMIDPTDIAEVCLFPFKTTTACCPVELTLRLQKDPFEK